MFRLRNKKIIFFDYALLTIGLSALLPELSHGQETSYPKLSHLYKGMMATLILF